MHHVWSRWWRTYAARARGPRMRIDFVNLRVILEPRSVLMRDLISNFNFVRTARELQT